MSHNSATPSDSAAKPNAAFEIKPLRLWPASLLLLVMVVSRWTTTIVEDGPTNLWMVPAFVPALCSLLILVWFVGLSRATWKERALGFGAIIGLIFVTFAILHPSMYGPAITTVTLPMGIGGFALALLAQGKSTTRRRTVVACIVAAAGFGFSGSLRASGMWGNFSETLDWRWNPSGEEQFLAERGSGMDRPDVAELEETADGLAAPEWPGFRGPNRDGVQRGVRLDPDWEANPPTELWRIRVGPAWSSFAVAGKRLFTQEQRGDHEAVVCYHADTGAELWEHRVEDRLNDPLGGPGPRGTPTIADESVFAMGAAGEFVRLNARDGEPIWTVDLRTLASRKTPMWGFSASPLIVDDIVVVYAGGKEDKGIFGLDIETGDVRWSSAAGEQSYGSPHALKLGPLNGVGLLSETGLQVVNAKSGALLLEHAWKVEGYRALQPMIAGENTIAIPTGAGTGTQLIRLNTKDGAMAAEEVWTSRQLKPDFSDCVTHRGFVYGFDGPIFACIDLREGVRQWKKGRYGKGQVLLVVDSNHLLITAENGDLVLLDATPEEHREVARLEALSGKTWNHPVLIGDRLYIRNAEEAVCYQLPVVSQ